MTDKLAKLTALKERFEQIREEARQRRVRCYREAHYAVQRMQEADADN